MKKILTFVAAIMLAIGAANAQELQFQYDFARSNSHAEPYMTATFTGTHFDKWGSTFYFVDFDFAKTASDKCVYGEIQRSLNFWSNTALKDFYVEVEYDGGVLYNFKEPLAFLNGPMSQAFLTGFAYSFHDETFRNFLQLQVLYRKFFDNNIGQAVPLQFTAVYTCKDLFNIKGLLFSGFADFWWQDRGAEWWGFDAEPTHVIFTAEPQLWYNVGQHFGMDNFHIGGELEISVNAYSSEKHFTTWPAAGVRWTF